MDDAANKIIFGFGIFLGIIVLMLPGCSQSIVRDKVTYQTELEFFSQVTTQTADTLQSFLDTYCVCNFDKHFTTTECQEAASQVVLIRSRIPYHKAMALYNAGILDVRPSKIPPVIPSTSTLCKEAD